MIGLETLTQRFLEFLDRRKFPKALCLQILKLRIGLARERHNRARRVA